MIGQRIDNSTGEIEVCKKDTLPEGKLIIETMIDEICKLNRRREKMVDNEVKLATMKKIIIDDKEQYAYHLRKNILRHLLLQQWDIEIVALHQHSLN